MSYSHLLLPEIQGKLGTWNTICYIITGAKKPLAPMTSFPWAQVLYSESEDRVSECVL